MYKPEAKPETQEMQSIYTTPPWIPTLPPSLPLKLPISNSKKQPSQLLLQTLNNSQVSPYIDADPTENGTDSLKVSLPAHVKSITSTSNPFVKHCVKLQRSSPYRHSHSSTLVVGSTPIREICSKQKLHRERTVDVECLFLLDKAQVPEGVDESSTRVLRVSAFVMKKISQIQSTESIDAIALMKFPTSYFVIGDNEVIDCRKWFPSPHRILVLEGIQDPGNLGNLIRSAVAFRWGGVFLLPGCCDPFGGRALRSSRGAAFQLPIVSGTWHHLEALRNEFNLKMVAGHPDKDTELKPVSRLTQELSDSLADVPLCLVLGSEGKGLTNKSFQECELVSIQMPGKFESLNVSVAGGIFMHMLQAENPRTV